MYEDFKHSRLSRNHECHGGIPRSLASKYDHRAAELPRQTGSETLEITFACGDGNFRVQSLTWTGWGGPFAAAAGTAIVNDCEPYCARGHFQNYPMVVIARGRQRCPDGTVAYLQTVHAFIGRSPYPKEVPADAAVDFPVSQCASRHADGESP